MNKLIKNIILIVAIISMIFATDNVKTASAYGTRLAYKVAFTHNDPWWEPHYGAWFFGSNGLSYWWIGQGSAPPYPNWWNTNYNVALLSKTWLFVYNSNGWTASNHKALLLY